MNSVNAAYLEAKHAVHSVGEALCTLGAVWIVCVQAAEVEAIPAGPVFYGVAFVAITFISDPNCTE